MVGDVFFGKPGEVEILQGLWSFTAEVWNSISQELREKHSGQMGLKQKNEKMFN